MQQKPIKATLFRCNACHAVQAVEVDYWNKKNARPGPDCPCGGHGWTRIKEVI